MDSVVLSPAHKSVSARFFEARPSAVSPAHESVASRFFGARSAVPMHAEGFSMSVSSSSSLTASASSASAGWKCQCCEAENAENDATCGTCMVPKPQKLVQLAPKAPPKKEEGFAWDQFGAPLSNPAISTGFPSTTSASAFGGSGFPAATEGFSLSAVSAPASSVSSSGWKCQCCEAENAEKDATCGTCMVPKPQTSGKEAAKKSAGFGGSSSAAFDSTSEQKQSGNSFGGGFEGFLMNAASAGPAAPAPSFGSGFPAATEGFSMNAASATASVSSSGWKCQCCEAENAENDATCGTCMVPKPQKTAGAAAKSSATPKKTVGFAEKKQTLGSVPESSFSFGSAGPTAPAPSFGSGFPAATEGFSMNAASAAAAVSGWKCQCCEAENAENDATCGTCMVPKPQKTAGAAAKSSATPKKTVGFAEKKQTLGSVPESSFSFGSAGPTAPAPSFGSGFPAATEGFSVNAVAPASSSLFSGWKCRCCEAENAENHATCGTCMVPKPQKASEAVVPTVVPAVAKGTHVFVAPASSVAGGGAAAKWACDVCDTENESNVERCCICKVVRKLSSSRPAATPLAKQIECSSIHKRVANQYAIFFSRSFVFIHNFLLDIFLAALLVCDKVLLPLRLLPLSAALRTMLHLRAASIQWGM